MNRTCRLTLGAVVLVACATGARDARAVGPTAPAPTIPPTPVLPKLSISVGAPVTLRTANAPIVFDQNTPFEHTFSGKGARFYVTAKGPLTNGVFTESDVFASADSGRTWTAGARYPTPNQSCANVAADAGNGNVVYLAYYGGHANVGGNTGATLRLAVSTDAGRTFPASYVLADSINSMPTLICPDIISPSPGAVIVSGIAETSNGDWAATWVAGGGQTIGPVNGPALTSANPTYFAPSETNAGTVQRGCSLVSNNLSMAPRLFTNGAGAVCVAYVENAGCVGMANQLAHFVQCSTNGGATWTPRKTIGAGKDGVMFGAISPSGSNVVLAWMKHLTTTDEIMLVFSHDGGQTFPELRQYPTASRNGISPGSYTGRPVVAWESESALWLAQTLNQSDAPVLMLDRTADDGKTWIGAVSAGSYMGTTVLSTGNGMVATGFGKGTLASVTFPLGIR